MSCKAAIVVSSGRAGPKATFQVPQRAQRLRQALLARRCPSWSLYSQLYLSGALAAHGSSTAADDEGALNFASSLVRRFLWCSHSLLSLSQASFAARGRPCHLPCPPVRLLALSVLSVSCGGRLLLCLTSSRCAGLVTLFCRYSANFHRLQQTSAAALPFRGRRDAL